MSSARRILLGICNNSAATCKQFNSMPMPMRACPTAITTLVTHIEDSTSSSKAYLHHSASNFCTYSKSSKRFVHSTPRCESDKNTEGNSKSSTKPSKIDDGIDIDEEMLRYDYEEFEFRPDEEEEQFIPEDLPPHLCQRGKDGVFDIEQLVKLLKDEKAKDLCAISIPPEYKYCDQMVIVTGNSTRHLVAMAEKVKKYFKIKRNPNDPESVMIEGLASGNWLAMDIGNIVLHLFLEKQRLKYNLEELWLLGPEFDEHCIKAEKEKASNLAFSDFSFDEDLEKFRNIRSKENEAEKQ